MENKEQYALITGATSGIGYQIARLFAHGGCNLVIVSRDIESLADKAQEFKKEFAVEVITIAKDLFDPEAGFELYNEVQAKGINIDYLVNDAGQGQYGEFVNSDIRRQLQIVQLNISSLIVLTQLFLKDMVNRGKGRIMNLSSIASKTPGPWQSVYHGTKAFVQSFTEAIHAELQDTGVTVTALLPGATDTDFFNKADMLGSKVVVEGELADPAAVALDGYNAMMAGDDMVVAGGKNKVTVAMAAVTPDQTLAKKMYKQQEPAKQDDHQ